MTAQLLAGLLGGLLALAGSLIAMLVQGRQQRALAQDERLWTRRAETYVAVLQHQGHGPPEGYQRVQTASEWPIRDELTAKVAAFATNAVRELWQQSALASLSLNEYVTEEWPQWSAAKGYEQQELEEEMAKDETFSQFRQASADAERRLAEQIHAELNTDHRVRSPLRGRWRQEGPARCARDPTTSDHSNGIGAYPEAGAEQDAATYRRTPRITSIPP